MIANRVLVYVKDDHVQFFWILPFFVRSNAFQKNFVCSGIRSECSKENKCFSFYSHVARENIENGALLTATSTCLLPNLFSTFSQMSVSTHLDREMALNLH